MNSTDTNTNTDTPSKVEISKYFAINSQGDGCFLRGDDGGSAQFPPPNH